MSVVSMIEAIDRRIGWRSGRGIIATGLVILLGFPAGCAVNSDYANSRRLMNAEMELQQGRSRLQTLKNQLFRCQQDIVAARQQIVDCRVELDRVDSTRIVKLRQVADALAKVKLMEEDLAKATGRQAEITSLLAPLQALEQQVATRQQLVAERTRQLTVLDAEIAASTQAIMDKSTELAGLKGQLAEFDRTRKLIDAARAALGPPAGAPPTPLQKATVPTPPKKTPPKK
ncbi:MAG: hypothetical protein VX951_11000 [Planctomycetota bacterium]|nr:hypothetical protein [Planctomycetota bacterium]